MLVALVALVALVHPMRLVRPVLFVLLVRLVRLVLPGRRRSRGVPTADVGNSCIVPPAPSSSGATGGGRIRAQDLPSGSAPRRYVLPVFGGR
ncbi:hypothetical protein [Frigoribacterium sp. PhB24]|uniref:hypothetical protein n=1 Tax=Frigoribacterium sp. PhB24 TaxID=2485204 RepID=UPI0011CECC19|nr:hypothetical protein [Frigoribacterium sp. PhB24]